MSAIYNPPLVSFIEATTGSVESPANTPLATGASPISRPDTTPARMPKAIFTAKRVPPLRRM